MLIGVVFFIWGGLSVEIFMWYKVIVMSVGKLDIGGELNFLVVVVRKKNFFFIKFFLVSLGVLILYLIKLLSFLVLSVSGF